MDNPSGEDSKEKVLFLNEVEAKRRFEIYKSRDPFPEIVPALLNSADVHDYVEATGMVAPFYPKYLKSASYEIGILGPVVYWDEKGEESNFDLKKGKEFILRRNSIAFVTPECQFRLPDYIALRFNLRITHVHRGILLGTGPLVDPGFEGRLLIPLHNLTTNDYKFTGGEPLIWVEFTKLSPHQRWNTISRTDSSNRNGEYVPFPEDKKNQLPSKYLSKASPNRPIRSSIPDAIRDAQRSAREASQSVRAITIAGFVGVLGISYPLYSSFQQSASLAQDSISYVTSAQRELTTLKDEVTHLASRPTEEEKRIRILESEVQELRKKVSDLTSALENNSQIPASPSSMKSSVPKDESQ